MSWTRNRAKIDAKAALDRIWVIRTRLGAGSVANAAEAYKSLAQVSHCRFSFGSPNSL